MRRSLVVGNWKMHGNSAGIAQLLEGVASGLEGVLSDGGSSVEVAVCPPAIYLSQVAQALGGTRVEWGAQNVSDQAEGPFTGEISAKMLTDLGCRFAIVGHSERRSHFGESDYLIAAKFRAALDEGVRPILCVGESLEQREVGRTLTVIESQMTAVINAVGVEAFAGGVVAYEPIWAIGTGRTATPEQAQEVHAHIRELLARSSKRVADNIQLLYGGSVKPDNAAELFTQHDIDGALVGGASLQAADFIAIVRAAQVAE